jgi:hypothetical protein
MKLAEYKKVNNFINLRMRTKEKIKNRKERKLKARKRLA